MEVARLPQRPSDLLNMQRSGHSAWARLSLDLGFAAFDRRFRQLAEETELVDAPKRSKGARPQIPRPKHDRAALLRVLGIDPEDERAAEMVAVSIAASDWDAIDDATDGENEDGE